MLTNPPAPLVPSSFVGFTVIFPSYAVIDWEIWVPWMILDTPSDAVWVNASVAYVREQHPDWNQSMLEAEAVRSWNESSARSVVAVNSLLGIAGRQL